MEKQIESLALDAETQQNKDGENVVAEGGAGLEVGGSCVIVGKAGTVILSASRRRITVFTSPVFVAVSSSSSSLFSSFGALCEAVMFLGLLPRPRRGVTQNSGAIGIQPQAFDHCRYPTLPSTKLTHSGVP